MTTTANTQPSPRAALASATVDKPIAIRLGRAELDEVLHFAHAEDLPAGNFARMIYLLGLAVYRQQGYLTLRVDMAQPARSRWQAASGLVNEKPIAMRLQPSEREAVETMASETGRRPGNFARVVFRMGMPIYRQRVQHLLADMPAFGAISNE
ncbi:hypothetical protein [Comamonas fluminis]|uniref:hypothetical protein n=1 Tax=Comamonas fluminis TaxID=2796366 RepID=UPI001C45131D|nr:hypothetical protein [Comamonas fluminis]